MNKQEIEIAIEIIASDKKAFESVNHGGFTNKIKAFELAISALEQQLTNGWIPVSTKLPEEKEEFEDIFDEMTLAIIDTKRHMVSDLVSVTVKDHEEDTVFVCDDCFVDGEWSNFDARTGRFEVIAWQPLPEPYKEVSDAERN